MTTGVDENTIKMVNDLNAAYARAERIQDKTNRRVQVETFEC